MKRSVYRLRDCFPILFLLLSGISYGQLSPVTGKVTAFGGIPLQNIPVEASKSKEQVQTDARGIFVLPCSKKDVVKIAAGSFKNKRINLKSPTEDTLFIELEYDLYQFELEEIIGSGWLNDADIPMARDYVEKNGPDYCIYSDMYEIFENCCPGVRVDHDSNPPKVSLYSSGYNVLYVVNGVENSFIDFLLPCDVKQVKVIKDAASLAAYGTKGADGVIAITTK
ncbi:MAG TPA: TonB-dependent receptor plug domain-containing protein [Prolixibacteraceae bacterium]|nr:TonB-dependent receptor plug domain-containing protein [Prolixibacteraceae bacterium]